MASRWRSAFISLVLLIVGVGGMVGLVMDSSSVITLGPQTVESWKVYSIFSALGFIMSGYALAGVLRRQTTDDGVEVDELEEEVEEAIFQLEPS